MFGILNALRRPTGSQLLLFRPLHTLQTWQLSTEKDRNSIVIIKTESDRKSYDHKETAEAYRDRSEQTLLTAIKEYLSNSKLIFITKVNQSVIDTHLWQKERKVKAFSPGHIVGGIFTPNLHPVEGTLVSRIERSMESMADILKHQLFCDTMIRAKRFGAREFYILVDFAETNLNIDLIQQREREYRNNLDIYSVEHSACVHAYYYIFTGQSLPGTFSTQKTAIECFKKIICNPQLVKLFIDTADESKLSQLGDQIALQTSTKPLLTR